MIKNRILCLVLAFFTCHFLVAQGKYYKEMKQLQTAIQKKIYDSSADYYKDVVSSKPNDNPYSYLWPICAMNQAVSIFFEPAQPASPYSTATTV